MADVKSPGLAAVLSAVIPGLGQFYNGDFLRGIFWLIVTPGLWIGSGGARLDLSTSSPPSRRTAGSKENPRVAPRLERVAPAVAHLFVRTRCCIPAVADLVCVASHVQHPALGGERLPLFDIHPFVTRSGRTGRAALLTLGLLAAGTIAAAQLQNPD